MNRNKLQIYSSAVFTIFAFSLGGCSFSGEPPDLTQITPGYQTVDDRGVLYKASNNQFLWGIVLPSSEALGLCSFGPARATASFQSGVALQLVNNTLTVTGRAKKVTIEIKPKMIYQLNADLTINSSEDLSGIQFIPRKQWSRDANGYVTIYDLTFPKNIYDRFGDKNIKRKF